MIHITVQQVTDDILKYKRRLFCPPTEYVVVTKPFIQVQKDPRSPIRRKKCFRFCAGVSDMFPSFA